MYVIFLRFDRNRARAREWMSAHSRWLEQGFADGVFIMAGSLENGQGGLVLTANVERNELAQRVALDPFVAHGVVTAEVHEVTPSRMVSGLAAVLDRARE